MPTKNTPPLACWLGTLSFAAAYWVVDAMVQVFVLRGGSLPTEILAPSLEAAVTRLSGVVLLGLMGLWSCRHQPLEIVEETPRDCKPLEDAGDDRFHQVYTNSPDATMLLDELGFLDCNQATLDLFGIELREGFVATHPADLSPPYQPDGRDSMSAAFHRIEQAMRDGSARFEWVHRRASGEIFQAEVTLTAIRVENKTQLHAIVRDVTEEKELRSQLQHSQDRLRLIVDALGDGVVMVDLETHLVHDANETFCQMMGLTLDELRGMPFLELHPPQARESMLHEFERHVRGEKKITENLPLIRKDGTIFYGDIKCEPLIVEGRQLLTGVLRQREPASGERSPWEPETELQTR